MNLDESTLPIPESTTKALAPSVRAYLCGHAQHSNPITYQALAKELAIAPPNSIHKLTLALEHLMAEDAQAQRPLIAALVISKARGGLPAPGFFDCVQRLGCFDSEKGAADFHAVEFERAINYWRAALRD